MGVLHPDIPTKTLRSSAYQALHEGPKTGREIGSGDVFTPSDRLRGLIGRLKPPGKNSGGRHTQTHGRARGVYFLWGDERRAVRKFIEVNESYVASSLDAHHSPLTNRWDDALVALLREEWAVYQDTTTAGDGHE